MSRSGLRLVAVLLGTDHHPFDRLATWSASLAGSGTADVFLQHGDTACPSGLRGAAMLGIDDLLELLERADAVVTHGGPGLIMDARNAGHLPVVVARDPQLGEHVDGHQQRFVRKMASTGCVAAVDTEPAFRAAVEAALERDRSTALRATGSSEAALRFGALVTALVDRRTGRRVMS